MDIKEKPRRQPGRELKQIPNNQLKTCSMANLTNQSVTADLKGELLQVVYSNGGNSPATLVFHSDDGHGWLQAPKSLCKALCISSQISGYSYQRGNFYYLEEDCDAAIFINALAKLFGVTDANLYEFYKIFNSVVPQEDYNGSAPIRNYQRVK